MTRTVRFNEVFREVNDFRGRYRALKGSAGAGKSFNVATDLVLRLMNPENEGANLLCVRKTFDANLYSTLPELTAAITRVCGAKAHELWEINRSVPRLTCRVNGNSVAFRGLFDEAQRERLKSITFPAGKLTWIWAEEASELSPTDLELLDDRLRGLIPPPLYYQITLTFNPVLRAHWLRERFFMGDSPEVLAHHSTYLDNRFIDAGFLRRMEERKIRDPSGYLVYGLGEWGVSEGLVFPNLAVTRFDRSPERFDALSMGQDFGFNHPNVLLLLGYRDGDVYVLAELFERGRDTSEIIALAEKGAFPKYIPMHCDCAEPDRIRMWQKAHYMAIGCRKHAGSVAGAIDWLKARRIFIHEECINTVRELSSYMWAKDRDGRFLDFPQGYADDAAAALRYGCEYWIPGFVGRKEEVREESRGLPYRDYLTGGSAYLSYLGY